LGQSLHDKIHHHSTDGHLLSGSECILAQTRAMGQMIKNHDDVFLKKDGTALIMEYTSASLEAHGQPIGLVLIARDITERKRLLTEMEKRAAQRTRAD
jgi:PAS domain S-box-containing protein